MSPQRPVSSYLTFSPLLPKQRLFSVTLLCLYRQLPVKKYGALCCPDFPLAFPRATDCPAVKIQRYGISVVLPTSLHKIDCKNTINSQDFPSEPRSIHLRWHFVIPCEVGKPVKKFPKFSYRLCLNVRNPRLSIGRDSSFYFVPCKMYCLVWDSSLRLRFV